MTTHTDPGFLSPYGAPAPVVRLFGWAMLAILVAFMIENVLIVTYSFPSVFTILNSSDSRVWINLAIYIAALIVAVWWIMRTPDRALRYDARNITRFNAYLIRGCFFAVLFVGVVDAAIAFVRVESLLPVLFSENWARDLIRARFIGPYIHMPLVALGFFVALFTRSLGFIWLALLIVLAELLIVISRFVFSYEQGFMGDLVRYWYAALFLFASAYTLLEEGHVRVDVFYAGLEPRRKGRVNAVGSILLGMVTMWAIILVGLGSKQALINSPVANFEITQGGTAGMYIKYQMAAFLAIFAVTMLIQFVSYLFEAVADMRDEPGHQDHEAAAH